MAEQEQVTGGIVRLELRDLCRLLALGKAKIAGAKVMRSRDGARDELALFLIGEPSFPVIGEGEDCPDVRIAWAGALSLLAVDPLPREEWGGW